MTPVTASRLPPWRRTTIIQGRVKHPKIIDLGIIALCLLAHGALAQQPSESKPETRPTARENAPGRDDLDVTMQIIVDPDAKLPDEVVRRIPLPERKPAFGEQSSNAADRPDKERAREAKELGREVGQSAKDRAKEAAEQREQARRAAAEERRRRNDRDRDRPPRDPPGRPPRP